MDANAVKEVQNSKKVKIVKEAKNAKVALFEKHIMYNASGFSNLESVYRIFEHVFPVRLLVHEKRDPRSRRLAKKLEKEEVG